MARGQFLGRGHASDVEFIVGVSPETREGQARELLADRLDWHRREDEPAWLRYFYLRYLRTLTSDCRPTRLCGADRQAVLPEVVHVLDDHDHSRRDEEEGRGRQNLDGGPPERHGGDGEGDEEGNHSVSSPARGDATLLAPASRWFSYSFSIGAGTMCATTGPLSRFGVPVLGTVDGPTSAVLFV